MARLAVGIDVGTSSVKAVALKKSGSGFALKSVSVADIRRGEYHPEESPQALAEAPLRALERISKDPAFKKKPCSFGVSGPRVAPRLFKFPPIKMGEIEAAVRFEAEQSIPFDLAQAALDYVLFGETMDEGKPAIEGLVVGVHREEVDRRFVLLKSAGFDPVVLDVDTLALANAYIGTEGVQQREVVALINIGARFTNLSIIFGPRRVFVRDIASGGDMLSRAVSEIYGLDLPMAEKRKREASLNPLDQLEGGFGEEFGEGGFDTGVTGEEEYVLLDSDDTHMGMTDTGDTLTGEEGFKMGGAAAPAPQQQPPTANRTVLGDALGDLVSEIQDTFKYYINRRIIPRVDKVKLCGGTAKFPEIDAFFEDQLDTPTELWNPFARLDVSAVSRKFPPNFLDEMGPMMAVATGLAMRSI